MTPKKWIESTMSSTSPGTGAAFSDSAIESTHAEKSSFFSRGLFLSKSNFRQLSSSMCLFLSVYFILLNI